jgi:hypothetical protein
MIFAFSSLTSNTKLEFWMDAFQELELEEGEELGFGKERNCKTERTQGIF